MHKPQVILRGQTMNLFYVAAQLSANALKKKMLMMMETARQINLSQEPLSCDMGVSVAHDTCIELEVVLFFCFFSQNMVTPCKLFCISPLPH